MKNLADWWLASAYVLAGATSLVILTSISPERVASQAFMLIIGLGLFLYLSRQEVAVYKTFAIIGYLASNLALIVTLVLGQSIRGATRWIAVGGSQLQFSELIKPLLIVSFAYFLEKYPPRNLKNILINAGLFILPTFLIFRQPDLGTAIIISLIWVSELFIAGLPLWAIITGGFSFAGLVSLLPRFLHDYQLNRLESFIDPFKDPLGSGYNVIQSIIAVGSGGIFGKGLGHGTQSHLRFLPERHTDFVFASLAEEFGLLGSVIILVLVGLLIIRVLRALTSTENTGNRLLLTGIVAYLAFQSFINIGMNIGLMPVTGVTLPLISYGGSSVLATAVTLGIAGSAIRSETSTPLLEIQ